MALLLKVAEEKTRITILFKFFGVNKINELTIISNKLTNTFTGLVTSCLEPDMACVPPIAQRCPK